MVQDEVELRSADAPDPSSSVLYGLLRTFRPRQWTKNVLVFAAPGAANALTQATPLRQTIVAFIVFCMAASGTYCINDSADVESDRRHPRKRKRPVAAGVVGISTARTVGFVLIVSAVGLSFVDRWQLAVTVGSYVVLTTLYSVKLKHIAVVDIVAVAMGFVLRAIAGATATGVPISNWFFIVTSFGSLFIVAGKRHAEGAEVGVDASELRSTLGEYSVSYLAYLRTVSTSAVLVGYCLWAFEKAAEASHTDPWYQLSILPFVLAILRYALLVDQGQGAAPEDVVLSDRPLQVIGAVWVVVFGVGVHLA